MKVFLLLGQALCKNLPEELGIFSSKEKALEHLREMKKTNPSLHEDYEDFYLECFVLDQPGEFVFFSLEK